MLIGVLLAAGRGSRMGRTKQLMPWPPPDGQSTIIAASFDAVDAHVQHMIVVLGHDADAVRHALGERVFTVAHCDADAPMYESIRAGVAAARDLHPSADVLVHPADHPAVRAGTIRTLIDAAGRYTGRAILPQHGDKGGHPVLVPANLTPRLIDHHGEGGLRQYWHDFPDLCHRLPVDDPGCVRDIDTPSDYDTGC